MTDYLDPSVVPLLIVKYPPFVCACGHPSEAHANFEPHACTRPACECDEFVLQGAKE